MGDFRTLKILDRFSGIFERMGADYCVMRSILAMKLTMDQRRVPTILGGARRREEGEQDENRFIKSLWIYLLFGLLLLPLIVIGDHYLIQMTLFFAFAMFLIMSSLISDFSSVLLDLRDRNILLAKPVSRITISLAKAIHISIYLFLLTASLAAVPLIAGLFRHGPLFFLIFVMALFLADLLILAGTALVYYLVLQYFDGEKLRDIINYVQILLSVSLAIGYQIIGRTFDLVSLGNSPKPGWWQALLPPAWFGSLFEIALKGSRSAMHSLPALLAFIVPAAGFLLYVRLMPAFESKMQKLGSGSGPSRVKVPPLNTCTARLLCRGHEERAFYRFALAMMKSERDFRLKVYPSIGFSIVIPLIIVLNHVQWDSFDSLRESKYYLSIYTSAAVIPTSIMMLKYSGRYKASWLFQAAPLKNFAHVFSGTLKAFLVRLYLPVFLLAAAVFCLIFGIDILPDMACALLASIVYSVLCTLLLKGSLPFSESFEASQESGTWKSIFYLIPMFGFMGIHYLFTFMEYGVYIYLLVLLLAAPASWGYASRKIWI